RRSTISIVASFWSPGSTSEVCRPLLGPRPLRERGQGWVAGGRWRFRGRGRLGVYLNLQLGLHSPDVERFRHALLIDGADRQPIEPVLRDFEGERVGVRGDTGHLLPRPSLVRRNVEEQFA